MTRKVLTVLGSIVFVYALLVALMFLMQRNMMYITGNHKPSIELTGISGLEEIHVNTADGHNLYGWYKKPASSDMATIVWFHGNASHAGITAERAKPYITKGYGLLAVEYRGYAGNPGVPTEEGLYKDARAFIDWLKKSGTIENNIVLYGESIGSGPAVQMATEYSTLRAVVLESPFTSTIDAASFHYPFVPVKWLIKDRYENIAKIQNIKSPLIVIYGNNDRIVPYRLGQKLYEKAPEPKSLIVIENGDHNNLDQFFVSEKIISLLSE